MKRVLCFLLCMVMMFSMAACGGQGQKDAAPPAMAADDAAANPESEAAEVAEEAPAEEAPAEEFADRLTISYAGSIGFGESQVYEGGTELHKWWEDKFNAEWDVTLLDGRSTDQVTTWINAEDLPDLTVWDFNSTELLNYADQGLLYRWPDNWKEQYPNLAKLYDLSPANAHYEDVLGGTYIYAVPMFANNFPAKYITEHTSVYVRKDYAEQAGYDLSQNEQTHSITISEFTDLMQKIKDSGVVEYPLYMMPNSLGTYMRLLTDHSGFTTDVPAFYIGSDGLYHWGPAEDESNIKETVRVIREQYQNGLIDQDFYLCTEDVPYLFSTGQGAVGFAPTTVGGIQRLVNVARNDLGLDVEKDYVCLVLTDDDGVAHQNPSLNYFRGLILRPDIDEAVAARIFAVMDYLATDEGMVTSMLGIEGTDWEYDENGDYVSLLPDHKLLTDVYGPIRPFRALVITTDDFSFVDPNNSPFAKNLSAEMFQVRSDLCNLDGKEYDWNLAGYSSPAMTQASLIYYDEYIRLILAEGDFDQIYADWLNEKMPVIQPVLDELNSGM